MNGTHKSFSLEYLSPILTRSSGTILSLILTLVLTRHLPPSEFGKFTFLSSLILMISFVGTLGSPSLIIKHNSRLDVSNEEKSHILLQCTTLTISITTCVALISYLFNTNTLSPLGEINVALFTLSCIGLSFTYLLSADLRAEHQITVGSLTEITVLPAFAVGLIVFLLFILDDLTFYSATCAFLISCVATAVITAATHKIRIPNRKPDRSPLRNTGEFGKSLSPFVLLAIIATAKGYLDIVLLQALSNSTEVAFYKTSVQISNLVIFVLAAMNMSLEPQASRLFTKGQDAELQKLVSSYTLIITIAALAVSIPLLATPTLILKLLYGEAYATNALPLMILVFSQVVNAMCGSASLVLNMSNNINTTNSGLILSVCIGLGLTCALAADYGALGASIGNAIGTIVLNLYLTIKLSEKTKIRSDIIFIATNSLSNIRRRQ